MDWINRLFRKPTVTPAPAPAEITAADVEAAIDRAGREAVFTRAATLGWTPSNPPPMWVWRAIAAEIIAETQAAPVTLH